MPRYLNLWEVDSSRMPADVNERLTLIKKMSDLMKQTLKDRPGSEWGSSLDGSRGFALSSTEGTWQDIAQTAAKFAPYVKSDVLQVMSIEEFDGVLKSLAG